MRHLGLRRIVLALLLLTFVGGGWLSATAQAVPPPCTMAMGTDEMPDAGLARTVDPDGPMPCEDGVLVCTKRLCCPGGATLLVAPPLPLPLPRGALRYLPTPPLRGGLSVEPELFPPIAV